MLGLFPKTWIRTVLLAALPLYCAACRDGSPTSPASPTSPSPCDFDAGSASHSTGGEGTFTANSGFGALFVEGNSSGNGSCTGRAVFEDVLRVGVPDSQPLTTRRALATVRIQYQMDGTGADQTAQDGQVILGFRPDRRSYIWSSATTSGPQNETREVEILVYLNKPSDDTPLDSPIEVQARLLLSTVNSQTATMSVSAQFLGIVSIRSEDGTPIPTFAVCSASGTDWKIP